MALRSNPAQGQVAQAPGVPMWGGKLSPVYCKGKPASVPCGTLVWPSAREGSPGARYPQVGARAWLTLRARKASPSATWRSGLTQCQDRQPTCQVSPRGNAVLTPAQGKGKGKGKPALAPRGVRVLPCTRTNNPNTINIIIFYYNWRY